MRPGASGYTGTSITTSSTGGQQAELTARPCLAFDFDGVLHPGAGWQSKYGPIDAEGIREAHQRGLAVAVITCSVLSQVARSLRRAGFTVEVDHELTRATWNGGPGGRRILVTARKVDCIGFVDDRAVNHQFGASWPETFAQLDVLRDRRAGFHTCADGGHRHWGADGAAGLLPVAEHEGQLWVLLSQRGRTLQDGGTWSIPGGAIEAGEDAWTAATRETLEEVEGLGRLERIGDAHTAPCPRGCGWSYTTYPAAAEMTEVRVRDPFETSAVRWVRIGDVPGMDLHPGLRATWPRLAAAIRTGAIQS